MGRTATTRPPLRLAAIQSQDPVVPAERLSLALVVLLGVTLGSGSAWRGLYDVSVWGPVALVILTCLVGSLIALPTRMSRLTAGCIGAFGLFAGFTTASTAWAESSSRAALEAQRWVLFTAILVLTVLLTRTDAHRRTLLVSLTGAGLAVAGYILFRILFGDAGGLFFRERLAEPLGYVNGQAAALLLLTWPLLALAEHHRHALIRGGAAAGACTVTGLALLAQSRGAALALLVSAVFVLIAFPGRVQRGWLFVVVTLGLGLAAPDLLAVYSGNPDAVMPPPETIVRRAGWLLVGGSLASGIAWALMTHLVRERLAVAPAWRSMKLIGTGGLVVLLIAGTAVLVGIIGDPVDRVRTQVDQFTQIDSGTSEGPRFLAGGSNRYDYWRVALLEFQAEPVRGVGAGNYTRDYFRLRETPEDVRQPHSFELQAAAELGAIGLALAIALLLGLVGAAVLWGRRAAQGLRDPAIGVAAGGMVSLWVAHTSVDWLHLIPSVTGVAICAAGVLLEVPNGKPNLSRGRLVVVAGTVVLIVFAASGIGRLTLAAHLRSQSEAALSDDADLAVRRANQALRLESGNIEALFIKAAAIARLGDYRGARATLQQAAEEEPHNFLPRALLGDLAVRRGDIATALRQYEAALTLNPRDESLERAAGRQRQLLRTR